MYLIDKSESIRVDLENGVIDLYSVEELDYQKSSININDLITIIKIYEKEKNNVR